MNNPTNHLAQWLALYDQNFRAPMQTTGWNAATENANNAGGRLQWALSQMDRFGGNGMGEKPDFFSGGPTNALAPYVQPDRFAGSMMPRRPMADPLRPQVNNYIARILGGR